MAMQLFLAALLTVAPAFEEFGDHLPEVSLLQTKISIGALGSEDDENDLVSVFEAEVVVTQKPRPLHKLSSEQQQKLLDARSRYSFFEKVPENATAESGNEGNEKSAEDLGDADKGDQGKEKSAEDQVDQGKGDQGKEKKGDQSADDDAVPEGKPTDGTPEKSKETASESKAAEDAATEDEGPTGDAPENNEEAATTEGAEEAAAEDDASSSEKAGEGAAGHAVEEGTVAAGEAAAEEDASAQDSLADAVDAGAEDTVDATADSGKNGSAAGDASAGASAVAARPIPSPISSSLSAPVRPDPTSMLMANANAVILLTLLAFACPQAAGGQGASAFARYTAEFVGTAVLVFTVFCAVIVGDPAFAVFAIACSLMVSIYALGHVSGANFNPAVTVALWISGKTASPDVVPYVCVQLAASLVASTGATWLLWDMGSLSFGPAQGSTLLQAAAVEVFYTFLLCFCVLNVAASRRHGNKNQFYGLAIGFCVIAGGYGGGAISGGCFNPAVALGVASATPLTSGLAMNFAAYAGAQLLGAVLASLFFRLLRPDDFQRSEVGEYGLFVKLLAEALGTFVLMATVCFNVAAGSAAAPLSIGAVLCVLVFSLGSVSGANFNPAVTLASWGASRSDPCEAVAQAWFYILVQLGSAIAAAVACKAMFGIDAKLQPMQEHYGHACFGEGIFTFLLCFVVLSVARIAEYAGLAIGMCVTVGAVAMGPISGGCLNPAVSVALAFASRDATFLVGYVSSQVAGAMAAAILFAVTQGHMEVKGADHR